MNYVRPCIVQPISLCLKYGPEVVEECGTLFRRLPSGDMKICKSSAPCKRSAQRWSRKGTVASVDAQRSESAYTEQCKYTPKVRSTGMAVRRTVRACGWTTVMTPMPLPVTHHALHTSSPTFPNIDHATRACENHRSPEVTGEQSDGALPLISGYKASVWQ